MTPQQKANEAVEIISKIMIELGSIEKQKEPVESENLSRRLGKVSDMLNSIKSQLVQTSAAKPQGKNKLDFSPYSNGNSSTNEGDASMMTPGKNEIIKNYMRNQLELQESEWEGYEEAINSLAEQLDAKTQEAEERGETITRLIDERDELVAMTTSLGERLQSLGQEKYQLLMEREAWTLEKQELTEKIVQLDKTLSMKDLELERYSDVCCQCISCFSYRTKVTYTVYSF